MIDRTNVASEIRSLEHLDTQVRQDLAYDLGSVVGLEMGVLGNLCQPILTLRAYIPPFSSR